LEGVSGLAHAGSASMTDFFHHGDGLLKAPTLFFGGQFMTHMASGKMRS
jgi:hypothetical protein